uniref:Uncharacterized protein n=1 Tax=Rhizophora mucronata TaxID=61149 RepID=A0A2P2QNU8_RHIMU
MRLPTSSAPQKHLSPPILSHLAPQLLQQPALQPLQRLLLSCLQEHVCNPWGRP